MTTVQERDIGKILSDIEYLKRDQSEMKEDFKVMKGDLTVIKDTLSEARGQWKALLIFGTFCSALGAFVFKIVGLLKGWL